MIMNRKQLFPRPPLKSLICVIIFCYPVLSAQWKPFFNTKTIQKAQIEISTENKSGNDLKKEGVNSISQIDISIEIPGINISKTQAKGTNYQNISIPGIHSFSSEIGKPRVPVQVIMQEVPFGSRTDIKVVSVHEKVFKNMDVIPVQNPETDNNFNNNEFEMDRETYSSSQSFPEKFVISSEKVIMRNRQYVRIEIALARTQPALKKLFVVSDIKIQVTLVNTETDNKLNNSLAFDIITGSLNESNMQVDNYMYGCTPEKYMILMDDQFSSNPELHNFITWKKLKGYDVVTVKTSDIDAGGSPDSSQIRNYMLNLSNENYPTYLLIIGDESDDNGVDGWSFLSLGSKGYTDLYYVSKEPLGDFPVPDCFYGRLPAKTNEELSTMLQKVISMDRTPPVTNMYNKITVSSQIQDKDFDDVADRRFCETADAIACYFEQNAGGVNYNCTRAIVNPQNATNNCEWNNSYSILWSPNTLIGNRVWNTFISNAEAVGRISSNIDNGCALVYHRDHGSNSGWGYPSFKIAQVDALMNGDLLPLVWSINCSTGAYHLSNNFMRHFLLHSNGGAYAVIAATSSSPSIVNDWLSHGLFTGLFNNYISWHNSSTNPDWSNDLPVPSTIIQGSARKHGPNLHFAKMFVLESYTSTEIQHEFELYHVFGDPEGEIVIHNPQTQTIAHPSSIETGEQTVQVMTDDDSVQVCLYSESLGIHLTALAKNGSAFFNINPASEGDINVVVTGFAKRPYEGIINVTNCSPSNPVFGFENPSLWNFTIGNGTLTSNTTYTTEGSASIRYGGNGYREITCIELETQDITGETSSLAFDFFIGTVQPNPNWIGQVQLKVSCPSANIYDLWIGNIELNGKPQGMFNIFTFNLPTNVVNALQGDHDDFVIRIALNTNVGSGPYYIDNMRFVP